MELIHIKKIEDLIIASTILTPPERADWMALLELMDDPQLLELEQILSSAQTPKVSVVRPVSVVPPVASQIPKLTHIVNLPSNVGIAQTAQKPLPKPVQPVVPQSIQSRPVAAPQSKQLSAFALKLRQMFKEPELPPAKPELDLPPGEEKLSLIPKSPAVVNTKSTPKKQPEASFEPILKLKPQSRPAEFSLAVPKPPAPQPVFEAVPHIIQPEFIKAAPPVDRPLIIPSGPPAEIPKNLEDLPKLTVSAMRSIGIPDILKSMKNLAGQHGYYEVVFNLEKSLLYQSYLKTGAAILKNEGNFGKFGTSGENEDYLTRVQFEEFADALREIQGG
jgi:hypothetical protein